MSDSAGQIDLDLVINQRGFERQVGSIENMARNAGKLIASAFAVKKLIDFGKQCLELGSDLSEVQNVVDVTFSSLNSNVNDFAKNAATTFGLSETMAKKYIGTFGAMSKAFGFSEKAAYDMSTALTGLSGDVASFYNISQDEAYTKLKSVFTGETETLKDLGVVMTQNALDQYALANGYGKVTAKMTEQEKVALRFAFVQEKLSLASGDFARTSDSWANQTRILKLQFDSLKASIGQGLISAFTPVIKVINTLMGKLVSLANTFKDFTAALFGNKSNSSGIAQTSTDISDATSNMESLGDATKSTAKEMKGLANIDEINTLGSSNDSSSSSVGSGVGNSIPSMVIEEPDTSAIDRFAEKIKNILQPAQLAFENFQKSLSLIIDNIGKCLSWLWDNILAPFASWTISDLIPAFFNLLSGALDVLNPVLEVFMDLGKWLWVEFLQPIASWTGGIIVDVLNGLADVLKDIGAWMSDNKPIIEGVAIVFGSLAGAIGLVKLGFAAYYGVLNLYNLCVSIATGETVLFGGALTAVNWPLVAIVAAVTAVIAAVVLLVKNWDWVKEVASNVWEEIKNCWSTAGNWFKTKVVDPIANLFSNMWNRIKNTTSNAWNWIVGLFSKGGQIFNGVVGSIGDVFKKIVNCILSGINKVIAAPFNVINGLLNKIRGFDIPIVGKVFSGLWGENPLPVPQIPYLARGGIVDSPTLAMVGEAGKEAVVPLENNTQGLDLLADKLLSRMGNVNNSMSTSNNDQPINIYVQMKDTTLGKVVIDSINKVNRLAGKNLIKTI